MTTQPASPRTLADELRARSDGALADLLATRADLLSPLPDDLSQLATRAGTRASVLRALERLDTFTLQTAEALTVAPHPCPYDTLASLLPGGEAELPHALDTLRARALLWGGPDGLRLVRTARELLAPAPGRLGGTGLGPTVADAAVGISPRRMQQLLVGAGLPASHDPVSAQLALTALFQDPDRMAELLAQAPQPAREALERLMWGPPYGEVSAHPSPPLRWLLDRGLLLPTGNPGTVVLPREAALHLRGGRAHQDLQAQPPELSVHATHEPLTVDSTAAGQAYTALTTVEELLLAWGGNPPPVLRAGGLGTRELKRTAVALDLPESQTAFWAELAHTAGLLAADGQADERYAPTPEYDEWLRESPALRWRRLVTAWLTTTRVPTLVGGRDAKGRVLSVLGPGLDRGPAAELRAMVLRLIADLPPGTAPTPESVRERLCWQRPRRMPDELRERLCAATLAEAELLGVTGRGALASYARPLGSVAATAAAAAGEPPAGPAEAASELARLLPDPVDYFLLQADLTAVAPGPLRREPGQVLAVAADIESTGGATVYRFTPTSVRRALDAGWSAADLHDFLSKWSRTPVPQPLSYLIDDGARRHGQLRVGQAQGYVRCDDEALLVQLLADRRSDPLRLRRIAPTVLVSPAAPDLLLERLREMGFAPAAEAQDGGVLTLGQATRRTPPRVAPRPVPDGPPPADAELLSAAVRAIRTGDHAAGSAPPMGSKPLGRGGGALPHTSPAMTLAALESAANSGSVVSIGYLGADGVAGARVLAPVRVGGGFVTAFDHTAEEMRTYPLHRITGTARLPEE